MHRCAALAVASVVAVLSGCGRASPSRVAAVAPADQHVLVRERLGDLPTVLAAHAELLGIGIDEGTAIVVQRDTFAVIGASRVFVYGGRDLPDSGQVYRSLRAGDRYDLRGRRQVPVLQRASGGR